MSAPNQKPKPRPRPRPRFAASSTETESAKPGSSSKSPIQDEDDMFIRNKNRSASSWNKINKAVDKREASRARSTESDSTDEESPWAKKSKRKPFERKTKARVQPLWTTEEGLIKLSTPEPDPGSDTGGSSVRSPRTPNKGASESTPKANRKRERSRSLSSPEPDVKLAEQLGRERARQLLGAMPQRKKSPENEIEDSDSDDDSNLPPELAKIKAESKKNAMNKTRTDSSTAPTIELTITLRPHPEDESGRSHVYSHKMKRSEKFEQLFADIADTHGFSVDRVVVVYNNQKVYPATTPQTLSMWGQVHLDAYEEHVYNYIKEVGSPPVDDHSVTVPTTSDPITFSAAESGAESDTSQVKSDTFKLQVRSGEKTVSVTVRKTTKCSAIVANVLQKIGKPASVAQKARIEVDGEKLSPDSEISEADLEDGDLIDIVGV